MAIRLASAIVVTVLSAFLLVGCEMQSSVPVDPLAVGPDLERIGVPAGPAASAMGASGGFDAWVNAKQIDLDCVVTFYQADGTYYVTEQHYAFFPWSSSLRISGREPSGDYTWHLLQGRLAVLRGASDYEGMAVGTDGGCIADAILTLVTAPVRLVDESADFKRSGEPVKLEGRWYEPIKRAAKVGLGEAAPLRDAAFYQRRGGGRVEMVLLMCGATDDVLIVRGYDYTLLGKGGVMVPSKIEAFRADSSGRVRHRIVQIKLK